MKGWWFEGQFRANPPSVEWKTLQKEHQFFMSSCLLDVMCANRMYHSLGRKWKFDLMSIHVYCKMLWENKYKKNYELICNGIFSAIYQVFFGE
jgi:hypothetical protein